MIRQRAFKLVLTSALGLSLTGCVAAAIPLVAGGALVRSQTDGEVAQPKTASAAAVQSEQTPQFGELTGAETKLASGEAFIGEAPAPDTYSATAEHSGRVWGFSKIADYARERMGADAMSAAPLSAMLADPASLSPQRARCSGSTPMILIDLDPAGALFDASAVAKLSPSEIASLDAYRAAGGFVAWISGNSAIAAGDIRTALQSSGLDPQGKDDLLLLRYPGDRKQTRREALASSSCLLAIAGDERSDFDELFNFLSNPDAALGLELLVDDGWFLIPPFSVDEPSNIAANKEAQP